MKQRGKQPASKKASDLSAPGAAAPEATVTRQKKATEVLAEKRRKAAAWKMPADLPPSELLPNRAQQRAEQEYRLLENAGSNDHALIKLDRARADQRDLDRQADRARKRKRAPVGVQEVAYVVAPDDEGVWGFRLARAEDDESLRMYSMEVNGREPGWAEVALVTDELAAKAQALRRLFNLGLPEPEIRQRLREIEEKALRKLGDPARKGLVREFRVAEAQRATVAEAQRATVDEPIDKPNSVTNVYVEKAVRVAAEALIGVWLPMLLERITRALALRHAKHCREAPTGAAEVLQSLKRGLVAYGPLVTLPPHIDVLAVRWAIEKLSPSRGGGRSGKLSRSQLEKILASPTKLAAARKRTR